MKFKGLLERELARLDDLSKERALNMEETKRLSLIMKHYEQIDETRDEFVHLDMSPEEITEHLRRMN